MPKYEEAAKILAEAEKAWSDGDRDPGRYTNFWLALNAAAGEGPDGAGLLSGLSINTPEWLVMLGKYPPMPVKMPLVVLEADAPEKTLNFVVYERQGGEVYPLNDFQAGTAKPIVSRGEIKVGDRVAVPGLFGYVSMVVGLDSNGDFFAETDKTLAVLEFDKDDRHCWTSACMINKACISKATR